MRSSSALPLCPIRSERCRSWTARWRSWCAAPARKRRGWWRGKSRRRPTSRARRIWPARGKSSSAASTVCWMPFKLRHADRHPCRNINQLFVWESDEVTHAHFSCFSILLSRHGLWTPALTVVTGLSKHSCLAINLKSLSSRAASSQLFGFFCLFFFLLVFQWS